MLLRRHEGTNYSKSRETRQAENVTAKPVTKEVEPSTAKKKKQSKKEVTTEE